MIFTVVDVKDSSKIAPDKSIVLGRKDSRSHRKYIAPSLHVSKVASGLGYLFMHDTHLSMYLSPVACCMCCSLQIGIHLYWYIF